MTREQIAEGFACRYVQYNDERGEFKDVARAAGMTQKRSLDECRAHAAVGKKNRKKAAGAVGWTADS